MTKGLCLRANDSRLLRSSRIASKDENHVRYWELTRQGRRTSMTYSYEYPNQPDREPFGESGIPIPPGPEPPIVESRRRAKWFISGAAAALLFAGTAAGVAVMNHTHHAVSSAPTTHSTTALQQWWAGAEKDFTDVQNASRDVDQAFSHYKPGALAAACQHVHDAAEVGMESHLPSPNPELTAELHAAVEDFHSAAHVCLAVVAGSQTDSDGAFFSSMAQGNKHMRAAQAIINRLLADV
jgi:hypothetical protein